MKTLTYNIESINNSGLTSIHFYDRSLKDIPFEFNNILIAGDGIYIVIKNSFGISFAKTNIMYSNNQLKNMEDDCLITSCEQPNLDIFNKILEMFKYMCTKTPPLELAINLYYDTIDNKYIIDVCKQIIGMAKAKYNYSEKFEFAENKTRYIRYLQIHSHNIMPASFSSTDDNDEKNALLCFYGVVGKIDENSKFYNVDMKFRYWNGIKFEYVSFDRIFNIKAKDAKLNQYEIDTLENIIEQTNIANEKEKIKKESDNPLLKDFYGILDSKNGI